MLGRGVAFPNDVQKSHILDAQRAPLLHKNAEYQQSLAFERKKKLSRRLLYGDDRCDVESTRDDISIVEHTPEK